MRVQRVKFLSRPLPPAPATIGEEETKKEANLKITSTTKPVGPMTKSTNQIERHPSFSERIFALLGVKRVSDEEYLKRLKQERDGYLERIQDLEEKKGMKDEDEFE